MHRVFICTNNKQLLGALVSRFTLERTTKHVGEFRVEILNVDELPLFVNFHGKTYLRGGKRVRFDKNDLQSFTLARFMPPNLLAFRGKTLVIDPDIFVLQDVYPLFELDMQGASIACRDSGGKGWASSMMLLDCGKLEHWKIGEILRKLETGEMDYQTLMTLGYESSVMELDPTWNSFDHLEEETKLLHFTRRQTQPWKTGLKRDFVVYKTRKSIFGVIPRLWVDFVLGRQPHRYVKHPDARQERLFFSRLAGALAHGYVSVDFIRDEVEREHVRSDIFEVLDKFAG